MKHTTELMSKLYSNNTTDEYKSLINDKIMEAAQVGYSELCDSEDTLVFSAINGSDDIAIEDRNYSEVTIANLVNDDSIKLNAVEDTIYSATQPDVEIPNEADQILPEGATLSDLEDPDDLGIIDKNKAGKDNHFSMANYEVPVLTFSDDEINRVYSATDDAAITAERLAGTYDMQLAYSLGDQAEMLKAYSVLAAGCGIDMSDVYEAGAAYSDYADDMKTEILANTPITSYFSELDDLSQRRYFSNLDDEVAKDVIFSVLDEGDDTITFSDVDNMVSEIYEDALYSDDDYEDALYSDDDYEDAIFSDVDDIYDAPIDAVFSSMDDYELADFCSNFSDEEVDLMFSMADDEDHAYTFSDVDDTMNYLYSTEVEGNTEALADASADLATTQDPELAEKVKALAEQNADQAAVAYSEGYFSDTDLENYMNACQIYSDIADDVLMDAYYSDYDDEYADAYYSDYDDEYADAYYSDYDDLSDQRIFALPECSDTLSSCFTCSID